MNLKLERPERLQFGMAEGEVLKFYSNHEMPAMGVKCTKVEEGWREATKQMVEGGRK